MDLRGIIKKKEDVGDFRYALEDYKYLPDVKIDVRDDEVETYSRIIDFYDSPPMQKLNLTDFDKVAVARLKALRIIERANVTIGEKFGEEWRKCIENDFRKQQLKEFEVLLFTIGEDPARMRWIKKFDHISHFLLRLAFADTEEKTRWFISLELDWFKYRLKLAGTSIVKEILKQTDFPGVMVEEKEKVKYKDDLLNSFQVLHKGGLPEMYKVPFVYALDLIRQRKVYLRNGYAYVPINDLVTIVCSEFRAHLSESMALIKKNIDQVKQDPRLRQLISDFDKRHTGSDYTAKKGSDGKIRCAELPPLAQKSFPLCMKTLYDVVVKDHHTKHHGRLQLGLFLKHIGLPMDESIKFWRTHFTKKPEIDSGRFDKQYLYNIRHMYGQEGRRADYTPYSCMKIINSSVGPGEHHGCPFKHSDATNLRSKLTDAGIQNDGIKEIMELVEKRHFPLACQKYFELTHDGWTVEGGVNHPNQYFEESKAVLTGSKTVKPEAKVETKRVNVYMKKDEPGDNDSSSPPEDMEVDEDDDEILELMNKGGW